MSNIRSNSPLSSLPQAKRAAPAAEVKGATQVATQDTFRGAQLQPQQAPKPTPFQKFVKTAAFVGIGGGVVGGAAAGIVALGAGLLGVSATPFVIGAGVVGALAGGYGGYWLDALTNISFGAPR